MKVSRKIQRKGADFLSVAEAIQLMLAFGGLIINLIGLVVTLITLHNNKKK